MTTPDRARELVERLGPDLCVDISDSIAGYSAVHIFSPEEAAILLALITDLSARLAEREKEVERDFSEAEYVAAIPACCSHQGIEEHMAMMLCWGLAAAVRAGEVMDCSGCDENTKTWTPERRQALAAFREKNNASI